MRVHEQLPVLPKLRPALTLGLIGVTLAVVKTRGSVVREAFGVRTLQLTLLYFGWAALTLPFGVWPGGSLDMLKGALPAAGCALVVLLCRPTQQTVDRIQRGVVMAAVLVGALALARNEREAGRLGTIGSLDANDLAAEVAFAIPFAIGLMRGRRAVPRLALGAAIAFLLYVLLETGSRGGVVAVAVSTLVLALGQAGARRYAALALLMVGGATMTAIAPAEFRTRFIAAYQGTDYNATSQFGREALWGRAFDYIRERPITGLGMANFPTIEGLSCQARRRQGLHEGGCPWMTVHNSYLQAASELGLPGGLLFVGFMASALGGAWPLWRTRRGRAGPGHRPELLATMVGFAVSAFFLSHAYSYILFGLASLVALARRAAAAPTSAVVPGAGVPGAGVPGAGTPGDSAPPPVRVRQRGGLRGVPRWEPAVAGPGGPWRAVAAGAPLRAGGARGGRRAPV